MHFFQTITNTTLNKQKGYQVERDKRSQQRTFQVQVRAIQQ